MTIWCMLLIVFGAGVVGGTINALTSDNGFILPVCKEGICRPGWLGNAFIGGAAAMISWSLYGPLAGESIDAVGDGELANSAKLTVAAVGGAVLIGVGGARWLSNEVDKRLLRAAGVELAGKDRKPELVGVMSTASPAAALEKAKEP